MKIRDMNHILNALLLSLMMIGCGTFVGNPEVDDDGNSGNAHYDPEDDPTILNGPGYIIDKDTAAGVYLTDAPIDGVKEVVIRIVRLAAKAESGKWIYMTLDDYAPVNLLSLQNGEKKLLSEGIELSAGKYSEMRLIVDADFQSYVVESDSTEQIPLEIPSADTSGIKIKDGFEVNAGSDVDVILDFDVRQSLKLVANNGQKLAEPAKNYKRNDADVKRDRTYKLSPVLRALKLKDAAKFAIELSETFTGVACLYPGDAKEEVLKTATDECAGSESSAKMAGKTAQFHFIAYGDYKLVLVPDSGSNKNLSVSFAPGSEQPLKVSVTP